jgi:hypothetical protein
MSNLGTYQIMTTIAKKVGGPISLAIGTLITGYCIGRTAEAGIKKSG